MTGLKNCTVSVFGLGLLGGSLAWKLSRDGAAKSVAGWSRNPETVRRAHEMGIIGRPCATAEECASLGNVLVLAVPIRSMEETGLRIRPAAGSGVRAVFDLASTKTEVGRKLAPLWGSRYAGFHPMAGKERGGLENADPDLFDGAVCAVVPFENTGEEALSLAEELAEALGGRPLRTGAEEHDAAAACISHFPVLVAASLALLAGKRWRIIPWCPFSRREGSGTRPAWREACLSSGPIWQAQTVNRSGGLPGNTGRFSTLFLQRLRKSSRPCLPGLPGAGRPFWRGKEP